MEYAEGKDLKHYMGKYKKINEKKARRWFKQILSAIKYIHAAGIAHRDLKGENVLLKREWFEGKMRRVCKLSDFGLSAVSFTTEQGPILVSTACGTRPYMAPEILNERVRHQKPYDPMKADIWALGVILFQMITNQYPFNFEDLSTMITLQMRHHLIFSKAPEASPDVKDLIHQILNPYPSARLTILGIESHPWLTSQEHSFMDNSTDSSSSSDHQKINKQLKKWNVFKPIRENVGKFSSSFYIFICRLPSTFFFIISPLTHLHSPLIVGSFPLLSQRSGNSEKVRAREAE